MLFVGAVEAKDRAGRHAARVTATRLPVSGYRDGSSEGFDLHSASSAPRVGRRNSPAEAGHYGRFLEARLKVAHYDGPAEAGHYGQD